MIHLSIKCRTYQKLLTQLWQSIPFFQPQIMLCLMIISILIGKDIQNCSLLYSEIHKTPLWTNPTDISYTSSKVGTWGRFNLVYKFVVNVWCGSLEGLNVVSKFVVNVWLWVHWLSWSQGSVHHLFGGWVSVVGCLYSCIRFAILAGVSSGTEASMN